MTLTHSRPLIPPPPPLPLPPLLDLTCSGTWEATGPARSCALWTRSPSPSTSRRPRRQSSSRRRLRRCPTRPCCSLWRCRSVVGCWPSTSLRPPQTGYGSCWSNYRCLHYYYRMAILVPKGHNTTPLWWDTVMKG